MAKLVGLVLLLAAIGCDAGGMTAGSAGVGGLSGTGGADAVDACDPACAADRIYDAYVQAVADYNTAATAFSSAYALALGMAQNQCRACAQTGCVCDAQTIAADATMQEWTDRKTAMDRVDQLWTAYVDACSVAGVTPKPKLS